MKSSSLKAIKCGGTMLCFALLLGALVSVRMVAETSQRYAFLEHVERELASPVLRAKMLENPEFRRISGVNERQAKLYASAFKILQQSSVDKLSAELRTIDPERLNISTDLRLSFEELRESSDNSNQEARAVERTRAAEELNQAWRALRQRECEVLKLSNCEAPFESEQAYGEGVLKGLPKIANLAFGVAQGLEQFFKESGYKLSPVQLKQAEETLIALRRSSQEIQAKREDLKVSDEREQAGENLRREKVKVLQARIEQELVSSLTSLAKRETPSKLRLSAYRILAPQLGLGPDIKEG